MELLGVLMALKAFKEPTTMTIFSDSQYVISNLVNGHVKRWFETEDYDKKNLDLWFEILDLYEYHDVTFEWIRGHNGNFYNEMADLLATHAATCLNIPEDNVQIVNFQKT